MMYGLVMVSQYQHSDTQTMSNKSDSEEEEEPSQETQTLQKERVPQPIVYGNSPISMKCPYCLQHIRSQIIAKPQLISVLTGFMLFIMFPNFVMLILVVILLQITATRKHRCSLCERELGSDGNFLIWIKDQIYSFQLGTSGLIISKKAIVSIGIGILIFGTLSWKVKNSYEPLEWVNVSWPEFKSKCSQELISPECSSFEGKGCKDWTGFIMKIEDNRKSLRRYYDHAISIYVKMPPVSADLGSPDLLITADSRVAFQFASLFDDLLHGDEVRFNATFSLMKKGPSQMLQTHHMHLVDLQKTGNHDNAIRIYFPAQEEKWMREKFEGRKLRKEEPKSEEPKPEQVKSEELKAEPTKEGEAKTQQNVLGQVFDKNQQTK